MIRKLITILGFPESPLAYVPCRQCNNRLLCVQKPTSKRWQLFRKIAFRCDTCRIAYQSDFKRNCVYILLPIILFLFGINQLSRYLSNQPPLTDEQVTHFSITVATYFSEIGLAPKPTVLMITLLILSLVFWLALRIPRWVGGWTKHTLINRPYQEIIDWQPARFF